MIDFTGSHFEKAISLWGIRWSVASPISDRPWEERMQERGVLMNNGTRSGQVRCLECGTVFADPYGGLR